MAGIGFVLRKLYRKDNLSGLLGACMHSVFASTGPWIFTVLALAIIGLISNHLVENSILMDFRSILIYNFSFSLVLSGPIFMICTRYLADSIHRRDVSTAIGMLFGGLSLLLLVSFCVASAFYFLYANLTPFVAVCAVINFVLVSSVWFFSIFVSALKNYKIITNAFFIGMLVAVLAITQLAGIYGVAGMLNGFSIGLCVIIGILAANIFAEYPYKPVKPLAFIPYFTKYPKVALSGLIYNMAIWSDKWIMWFAPEATKLEIGLRVYSDYDSAMFMAYLTTVPVMAIFLFNTETHFFERYLKFYRNIEQKVSLSEIQKSHRDIILSIFRNAGYLLVTQIVITSICILMAPKIIGLLNWNYMQVGILRYGLAGALFQVLTLFIIIIMSYFDNWKATLQIQLLFLVTNTALTAASLYSGFEYYGYGYFLSSFITFIVSVVIASVYVSKLPYHTFITRNSSIYIN
ncbi:MAG: hypothetical protein COV35_05835 [Alphaproteobacteria bacterium CG11_big_fil_rev_8_21_14_0_20_39_49]|nr:MAG: hypothetical protein COV35_05835 [Alphaproteobacteria bacterium CG11_big_fil_rev_8_21_14_0_20_39_49]